MHQLRQILKLLLKCKLHICWCTMILNLIMSRSVIFLKDHKKRILELSHNDVKISDIHQILQDEYHVNITQWTLHNQLCTWQIIKNTWANTSDEFHDQIRELYLLRLSDKNILQILENEDSKIIQFFLICIWKKLRLKNRVDLINKEIADAEMLSIVEVELWKRIIESYEWDMLHAHFWEQDHLISWSLSSSTCCLALLTHYSIQLYDLIKILNSDDVAQWRYDLQRTRDEYIVSDFNFIWSINDYCKLNMFEFKIYKIIDAYSQYIVWIYVEILSHISINCLRQFLDLTKETDKISRVIRFNWEVKTDLLAVTHHHLRQDHESNILFKNCFFYETSIKNQCIESWWNQLNKMLIYRWRVCYLLNSNSFSY